MLLSALARLREPTSRSAISFLKSAGSAFAPVGLRAAITAALTCGAPINPVGLPAPGAMVGAPMNPVGLDAGGVDPAAGAEPMNVPRGTPAVAGFCDIASENASSLTSSSTSPYLASSL